MLEKVKNVHSIPYRRKKQGQDTTHNFDILRILF